MRCFLVEVLVTLILCAAQPYAPSECPAQSQYEQRRSVVLGWARQLLNGSLGTAGSSYGNRAFLRDTNTIVDVALDYSDASAVRKVMLGLFMWQHSNGDAGSCCVSFDKDLNPQGGSGTGDGEKADVTTDAESSLVSTIYKYVQHTKDTSILDANVSSWKDPVARPVRERLAMLLGYLGNATGRFSTKYGLIWGGVCADWGDVQEHFSQTGGCQIGPQSTIAINPYANGMYIIAMKNYAQLLEATNPDEARIWRARANVTGEAMMRHLWMDAQQKFVPHLYDIGPVCGDSGGSTKYECWPSTPSPFLNIPNFTEQDIYYHGATAIAIEAGLLSRAQVREALARMRANVAAAAALPGSHGQKLTIGLTMWPPYPDAAFGPPGCNGTIPGSCKMPPFNYQNAGDWTWFGARMVQQLLRHGMIDEALQEMRPMVDRVCDKKDFMEWYGQKNDPQGSTRFHGSAGELGLAIKMLHTALQTRDALLTV